MRKILLFCGFVVACGGGGGSEKPAEAPDPAEEEAINDEKAGAKPKHHGDEEGNGGEEEGKGKGKGKGPVGDPEFKDGMTVEEAIQAVPQGTSRENVDQEELGKPLMNEDLYKPCKLGPNNHFKVRIAIWDGKAVGMDVNSTPKNEKLEGCVKDQIKTVNWKQKVKSLNTVEYQF